MSLRPRSSLLLLRLPHSLQSFRPCTSRPLLPALGRVLYRPTPASLGARTHHLAPRLKHHHLPSAFSSSFAYLALAVGVSIAAFYTWPAVSAAPQQTILDPQLQAENDAMALDQPLEGHVGNLTEEQAAKLRELWHTLFSIAGLMPGEAPMMAPGASPNQSRTASISDATSGTPKKGKKRFGMFRRGGDDDDAGDDKHGELKEYKQALQDQTPVELRNTIWSFVKLDNPDALMLRFLRARKWNVQKALIMMISTVHWRGQVVHLDDDLTIKGEEWFAVQDKSGTGADKQLGHDFMAQIRMGKSFIHGCDNEGRPLCYVRVKLHRGGEQLEEALEKYTIYTIETARMMLRNRVETATIIFDMTDFSMANMDYTPVKFMIKCFEANYPECLGAVCVFKSPWIFGQVWNVIKGWLDPVVASKVHFTKDASELSKFIPMERIPKYMGGGDDWEYSFTEPVEGENRLLHEDGEAERQRLADERWKLVLAFEAETVKWIRSYGQDDEQIQAQRLKIADQLNKNYWEQDPYVRARTVYDREGVIQPGGGVDFYPESKAANKANGAAGFLAPGGDPRQSVDGASIYYDAEDGLD